MTDNEIIKALESCVESDCKNCAENCGSAMCLRNLVKDSADLIIRQKAEVEELEIELQAMRNAANGYKAEFERLMPFDYQENCCGSEKYNSKDIPEYSFHCVEAPIDGEDPIIEFVSFREFVKIIFKEYRSKKRAERKLRRMIKRKQ